jgi:hypothetical protein
MLEGRWEFTWVYLPPGWEPQEADGMAANRHLNHVAESIVEDTGSLIRDVKESGE